MCLISRQLIDSKFNLNIEIYHKLIYRWINTSLVFNKSFKTIYIYTSKAYQILQFENVYMSKNLGIMMLILNLLFRRNAL